MTAHNQSTNASDKRPPLRLAVLISGGGRTLENIAAAIKDGSLNAIVTVVISSNAKAYGIERARNLDIPTHVTPSKSFASPKEFSDVVFGHIDAAGADLVCMAGWLSLLPIPDRYAGKVINVHPALLPSFGGKGMYGHHVHEAVIAHGCKVSGCTIHFADQSYDTGPIILQRCCPVLEDDTGETLAARVFEQECGAYIDALRLFAANRVRIEGRRVRIVNA